MKFLIDKDLVYKRNISLSPQAVQIINEYFQPFKECSAHYSFNKSKDNFEIVVYAQKITLSEEDMAIIHEVLAFFWNIELTLFDFSLSGYSFRLNAIGEQDIDFNIEEEK